MKRYITYFAQRGGVTTPIYWDSTENEDAKEYILMSEQPTAYDQESNTINSIKSNILVNIYSQDKNPAEIFREYQSFFDYVKNRKAPLALSLPSEITNEILYVDYMFAVNRMRYVGFDANYHVVGFEIEISYRYDSDTINI